MSETLLSEATVHLFGRESEDLKLDVSKYGDRSGLARALKRADPRLARIYAFVFQNEYFDLASPALFVVDGPGEPVEPDRLASTGLAATPPDLSEDLTVWQQERGDLTIRLDVMTGSFDRVLLDYELADIGLQDFVRGGSQLGTPTAVNARARRRPRGWRSEDE